MRFVMRLLVFVVLILAAFWFTARNASELVNVVLPFLRIRASLPLVVFACILGGMGLSAFLAWRAERRARQRASRAAAAPPPQQPSYASREGPSAEPASSPAVPAEAAEEPASPAAAPPPGRAEPPTPAEPSPLL